MTEHGWERDEWPAIFERVIAADILVLVTPIWLGEKSSVCTQVIERLYGNSHLLNDAGQYAYYGRTAGCLVTGNEDGVKHCAMNILYSLQHLGYTVPPQADAGWIGEAGPASRRTAISARSGKRAAGSTIRIRSTADPSQPGRS
jgi:multimeric flavodoxin WrbA